MAFTSGDTLKVKYMLERYQDPEVQHRISGRTALVHAAYCGNIEVLQMLLQCGANVNF